MPNTITAAVAIPSASISSSVVIPSATITKSVAIPYTPSLSFSPAPVGRWQGDYGVTSGSGIASSWLPSITSLASLFTSPVGFRPLYSTLDYGMTFDGVNDYLAASSATFVNGITVLTGSFAMVLTTGSIGSQQILVSAASTTVAGNYFDIGITASGKIYLVYNQTEWNYAEGTAVLLPNTNYVIVARTTADTKQWTLYINGTADTLNYDGGFNAARTKKWFSGTGVNGLSLCAKREASATTLPFSGRIFDVAWWIPMITDPQVAADTQYFKAKWKF